MADTGLVLTADEVDAKEPVSEQFPAPNQLSSCAEVVYLKVFLGKKVLGSIRR